MTGSRRDGLLVACALTALLGCPAVTRGAGRSAGPIVVRASRLPPLGSAGHGGLCTREDAQSAGPGATNASAGPHPAAAPEANAIAAEVVHSLPSVTVESHQLPTPARRASWPARLVDHFVDHFDLATKLRAIRRLKIVPMFDNARITVYLGVDHSGIAGLHIQQQDANDLPPLFARNAPVAESVALRTAPLRLP
jgi:hypothetical protein